MVFQSVRLAAPSRSRLFVLRVVARLRDLRPLDEAADAARRLGRAHRGGRGLARSQARSAACARAAPILYFQQVELVAGPPAAFPIASSGVPGPLPAGCALGC